MRLAAAVFIASTIAFSAPTVMTLLSRHDTAQAQSSDAPFQVAAIYTFRGDKIARVDFAR